MAAREPAMDSRIRSPAAAALALAAAVLAPNLTTRSQSEQQGHVGDSSRLQHILCSMTARQRSTMARPTQSPADLNNA